MALERIPADIKKDGGIARASDPSMIKEIMEATSIPVMAKARIGHFAEAQVESRVNKLLLGWVNFPRNQAESRKKRKTFLADF